MGQEVFIDQRPVRDAFDLTGQAQMDYSTGAWVDLITFSTRCGYIPRLTLVGANVDAGAEAYVQFRVLVNGNPLPDRLYCLFSSAPAVVYDPGARIIRPIEIQQAGYVQFQARLVGASANYYAYGRMRVEYVDQ